MHVGCVTRHRYPTDQEVRVTRLASALSGAGHSVFVLCPGNANDLDHGSFEFGSIRRLVPRGRLSTVVLSPLPINPAWFWWLVIQFQRLRLDLTIVRDLRLSLPVLAAAKFCGIPTVLDLGEHYPGMMEILGKQRLSHYITRDGWLIEKLEATAVALADRVWVVVEENRQRLSKYSSHIDVIGNYPLVKVPSEAQRNARTYSIDGPPLKIVSLGLIDNIRGLDLAIEAFSLLERDLGNIQLQIFGDGFFRQTLEQSVQERGLQRKVVFGGWVAEERKHIVLAEGDIGIILHRVCALTEHTVPNKLFDYMYAGLPVLSTRLGPVTRILDIEECGMAADENPQSVAAGLKKLLLDTPLRDRFGKNGRLAVGSRYTWNRETPKVLASIQLALNTPSRTSRHHSRR